MTKANRLDGLETALAVADLEAQVAELKEELKLVQGQRDASNRHIEVLTDEVTAKALRIEELETRWETAGKSIDQMLELAQRQASVIREQRERIEAYLSEPMLQAALDDKGPWAVSDWSNGRIAVQSDDFDHDVALEVTGDWAEPGEKRKYAEQLAAVLNASLRLQAAEQQGEVAVITDEDGKCVAVTRQDEEGKILATIWEYDPNNELGRSSLRPQAASLQGEGEKAGEEDIVAHGLTLQDLQNAQNGAQPAKQIIRPLQDGEKRGETGVTDSQAVAELVTRNQALDAEVIRLRRRIEELGGKPPKRDRAAYMRHYRATHKPVLLEPGKSTVKFV